MLCCQPQKVVNTISLRGNKAYKDDDVDSVNGEIYFLSSQIRDSQPTYHRKGKNKGWKDRDIDLKDQGWRDHDHGHDWRVKEWQKD